MGVAEGLKVGRGKVGNTLRRTEGGGKGLKVGSGRRQWGSGEYVGKGRGGLKRTEGWGKSGEHVGEDEIGLEKG
jgi:hypothetical protein